jgi:hypothetical protein
MHARPNVKGFEDNHNTFVSCFQTLYASILEPTTMGELKKDVVMTLVLLEQEFPPSFFDIMTHLLLHLVEELELCGLVHTCWMYPIERYLKTLKGYV